MNQQPTCIDCGRTVHDGADTALILLGGAWKCEGACPCPECGKPLALETGHPASQDDPGQEPRLFCESCGHQQTAPGVQAQDTDGVAPSHGPSDAELLRIIVTLPMASQGFRDAIKVAKARHGATGVPVVVAVNPSRDQGPCTVCGVPWAKHGTAPTCASHDYTSGVDVPATPN